MSGGNYLGDFALGSTIHTKFSTINPTNGLPMTLAGSPVVSAYLDNDTGELTAGITLTLDFDGRTGLHHVAVVATSGNGYATGKHYVLVITTGTVGGGSVIGYIVGEFSVEARSSLRPTTAGRTLLVDASGGVSVTTPQGIKKNTAFSNFTFTMYDSANLPKTGLSSFTAQEWIDGADAASLSGTITEKASGVYKLDTLTADELNGAGIMLRFAASGAADTFVWIKTVSP